MQLCVLIICLREGREVTFSTKKRGDAFIFVTALALVTRLLRDTRALSSMFTGRSMFKLIFNSVSKLRSKSEVKFHRFLVIV